MSPKSARRRPQQDSSPCSNDWLSFDLYILIAKRCRATLSLFSLPRELVTSRHTRWVGQWRRRWRRSAFVVLCLCFPARRARYQRLTFSLHLSSYPPWCATDPHHQAARRVRVRAAATTTKMNVVKARRERGDIFVAEELIAASSESEGKSVAPGPSVLVRHTSLSKWRWSRCCNHTTVRAPPRRRDPLLCTRFSLSLSHKLISLSSSFSQATSQPQYPWRRGAGDEHRHGNAGAPNGPDRAGAPEPSARAQKLSRALLLVRSLASPSFYWHESTTPR